MTQIQFQTTGNLAGDPELRFTGSGAAVANITVAVTDRKRDAAGNWVDGDTSFLRGAAWRELGEHVAESLSSGDRVNVTGTLRQRSYKTNEGEDRTTWEATFETVAPDLRFATARVTKAGRTQAADQSGTDEYHQAVQNLRTVGAQPVESPF